jgi:hypothetical protein
VGWGVKKKKKSMLLRTWLPYQRPKAHTANLKLRFQPLFKK